MQNETILHVGIDDTDSPKGMCTTFLCYEIVKFLEKQEIQFMDFPYLIRFNPNIPWKTRGNGAVRLTIRAKDPKKIKNKITQFVANYSDTKNGANPGLVFFQSKEIPLPFHKFSKLALWKLISRTQAKQFVSENNIESFSSVNFFCLIIEIQHIPGAFTCSVYKPRKLGWRKMAENGLKDHPVVTFGCLIRI